MNVEASKLPVAVLRTPKHKPGMEQPRNLGARLVEDLGKQDERFAGIDHLWFLDTDVTVAPDALEMYASACELHDYSRVLIGPYEWLPPGRIDQLAELRNDPRWASFDKHDPGDVLRSDLSAGLACFSGNIVWPLDEFKRVGGFWDELHHGRCEDGEIGLRAVAMGVPISFVRAARGWHIHHSRNYQWIEETNAVDVPKINERHPWQELGEGGEEIFVVEEDGRRFNWRCPNCGKDMNAGLIWPHKASCHPKP